MHIFGGQIDSATAGAVSRLSIILVVSIGMAIMMTIGFIRVIYNIPLNVTLTVIYGVVLVLSLFVTSEFLAFSFDAAGAATGALSVPFILALSRGISSLQKDSEASENNSFGLLAVTLPGAILGIMVMSLISNPGEIISESQAVSSTSGIILPFLHEVPNVVPEILFALSPIFIMYLIFEKRVFKLSKTSRKKIRKEILYSFIGFVLFLTGVNAGFMEVGRLVGYNIATLDNNILLISVGFVLGLVIVFAEPAVHTLTNQIEDVTSGYNELSHHLIFIKI